MARKFTLELIMDLATRIGANPTKALSRSNVSFLGKGPQQNPLFQRPLPGLENATEANLGKPETLFKAVEDAVGWMKDGKLNSIQSEILGRNLTGIEKIINPPPLPMATVSQFPKRGSGITSTQPYKSMLPEPGPGDAAAYAGALDMQTGMSRAIARNLLLKDTRLNLKPEDLFMLKEGKGEPLDMMRKYYGESMHLYDDFLNSVNIEAARPDEFAEMILKNIKLIPQFAGGGLAKILEVNDTVNRYDLM
jgi:hypothetical protein